jgi:DNA processing protein
LGIDTTAHESCLEYKGKTIAVLAHGLLSSISPISNTNLANQIIENDGCLISEYKINQTASAYTFVERDRIQALLSNGVIVIETSIEGGTMHTANYAVENNLSLAVVKHPVEFNNSQMNMGNKKLMIDFNPFIVNRSIDVQDYLELLKSTHSLLQNKDNSRVEQIEFF